jgi:hypothetical protein
MYWVNPLALLALAAAAAPILIHILIQRRAERFPFPTLRFLQPTRLASIRRHVLEDPALLVVRVSILVSAAFALAGPLLLTAARREAWDRRLVRAIVVDGGASAADVTEEGGDRRTIVMQRQFDGPSLADSIRRATLWLETTPPARREIVVVSPLAIGSITHADIASVSNDIGVRFQKSATLPAARTADGGRLLTADRVRAREVTLTGDRTSFRDVDVGGVSVWPIEVISSERDRQVIDAAIAAVRSRNVWVAAPDRRARLELVAPGDQATESARPDPTIEASPVQQPWMAQAIAKIATDPDLRGAGVRTAAGLANQRFSSAPWQTLALAADGRPLAAAAGSADRLLVASAAEASSLATPVLLRTIANAIATMPDLRRAEVTPISDAMLQQWSRPPAPVASPRIDTIERDDRRWLWLIALSLLALETWMRRLRASAGTERRTEERARVA